MKKANFVLVVGSLLMAMRLFFPVLQCNNDECSGQRVLFFSPAPRGDTSLHTNRTVMQSFGIGIITISLYYALKKK